MKYNCLFFGDLMKKNLNFYLLCISLIFVFVSCASTKKVNDDEVVQETEVSAPVEEQVVEKENNNFIGWIGVKGKDVSFSAGNVKVYGKTKLGTFNIYIVNSQNKEIPVLSVFNEFSSSGFYLKQGKKIYNLNADSKVAIYTLKTDSGIKFAYSIPNVADVIISFDCMKSSPKNDFDMVKVSANVKNASSKIDDFALKCVLDTVFGENKTYHFYTSNGVGIKNEALYRTMKNEKWFVSKNDENSFQVLLNGADITEPEVVFLANKRTLETTVWEPSISYQKSFDNVLAYNDSAIEIIWKSKSLMQEESFNEVFYFAVATDGKRVRGYDYIFAKDKKLPFRDLEPVVKEVEINVVVEPEVFVEPEVVVEKEEKVIPNVKFDVSTLSKEKFTQEYIQSLIERISELEDDGANTNRNEILMLNAELDAILEVLRQ